MLRLWPLAVLTPTCLASPAKPHWINSLKDVQLYLKPKYNLIRTWDQEFGVQASVFKEGNFLLQSNLCYDPNYPIDFHSKPHYSLGFAFVYYFAPLPFKPGIYTKPKYNLVNLWKQETGLTLRLFTSRSFVVSANAAYVYNYPYIAGQKPNWLGLVNFQFPLGH
jgi:hypothetical protein